MTASLVNANSDNEERIQLQGDGASGEIHRLKFHNRTLYRLLSEVSEEERSIAARNVLEIGGEVLAHMSHRGDLGQVTNAIERLDAEGKRIIDAAMTATDKLVDDTVTKLTQQLACEDGPLAGFFEKFDPSADGNVVEIFRDLVSSTIAKATKQAVTDLAESTREDIESLRKSIAALDKVAAAEEARLAEAKKGTAKGREHELTVETLLGAMVAVTGDELDDVSTVIGLDGSKKGDKVVLVQGGVPIVTEEKCTQPVTAAKARVLLSEAMSNRGADFGMLIVDDETKVPGNQPYHLIGDQMVVVAADPLTLRLVFHLMRSKAIAAAQAIRLVNDHTAVDALNTIRRYVDDIARALETFKLIKTEHTKASKAIAQAVGYTDELGSSIAKSITEIALLIREAVGEHRPEEAA